MHDSLLMRRFDGLGDLFSDGEPFLQRTGLV
jgi:hypothetical protein